MFLACTMATIAAKKNSIDPSVLQNQVCLGCCEDNVNFTLCIFCVRNVDAKTVMLCETVCRSLLTSATGVGTMCTKNGHVVTPSGQVGPHWCEHLHVWTLARRDSEIHDGETWDIERRSLVCTRQNRSENVRAHR